MVNKKKFNWFGGEETIMKDRGNSFSLLVGKPKSHTALFSLNPPKSKKNNSPWFSNTQKSKKPFSPVFGGGKKRTEKVSFMKPVQINTIFNRAKGPNILTSEELLYGKKNLRKYGDSDMDGSPNKWDCSPFKIDKDNAIDWLRKEVVKAISDSSKKKKLTAKEKKLAAFTKRVDKIDKSLYNLALKEKQTEDAERATSRQAKDLESAEKKAQARIERLRIRRPTEYAVGGAEIIPLSGEQKKGVYGTIPFERMTAEAVLKKGLKDRETQILEDYKTQATALKLKKFSLTSEDVDKRTDKLIEAYKKKNNKKTVPKDMQDKLRAKAREELKTENKFFTEKERKEAEKQAELEAKAEGAIASYAESKKRFEEGGREFGDWGKIRTKEEAIAKGLSEGKEPTPTELKKLFEAREKYKGTHVAPVIAEDIARLKEAGVDISKGNIGGALGAISRLEAPKAEAIKAEIKAAEWRPAQREFSRGIGKTAAGVLSTFLPMGTLTGRPPRTGSFSGGAGRPKGSYKYYIPGQGAVDVYTWRKWDRQQRSMQRLQGQLPEQSPEYQMQQQLLKQAQAVAPNQGINDQGNYDSSQYNAPQIYDQANLPPDQAIEIKNQQQEYQRAMMNQKYQQVMGQIQMQNQNQNQQQVRLVNRNQPVVGMGQVQMNGQAPLAVRGAPPQFKNEKQFRQYQEQASDNVLKAPSIMKGDMIGTGTNPFTYTSPEQNVLNAPNAFMGEMRNIDNRGKEIPAVRLSEKAIPNPHGDQYTEIDPMSGKVSLKRRISEKWMTGEAY